MSAAPKLIALCGVDGVGKSSLVASLAEHPALGGATFLKKTESWNIDALEGAFRRPRGDWTDWNDGPFAEAAAIGAAMEFLRHEQTRIAPALAAGHVVCDRHAICYATYLQSVRSGLGHDDFFGSVRRPDLLILVEVEEARLGRRLHARGAVGEDENPVLSARLRAAYRQLLTQYSKRSVIVSNDGAYPRTRDAVFAAVSTVFASPLTSTTGSAAQLEV